MFLFSVLFDLLHYFCLIFRYWCDFSWLFSIYNWIFQDFRRSLIFCSELFQTFQKFSGSFVVFRNISNIIQRFKNYSIFSAFIQEFSGVFGIFFRTFQDFSGVFSDFQKFVFCLPIFRNSSLKVKSEVSPSLHLSAYIYISLSTSLSEYASICLSKRFSSFYRFSHHEWTNPNPADPDPEELENIWNNSNSFWLMIGSIMQQGCDILPK